MELLHESITEAAKEKVKGAWDYAKKNPGKIALGLAAAGAAAYGAHKYLDHGDAKTPTTTTTQQHSNTNTEPYDKEYKKMEKVIHDPKVTVAQKNAAIKQYNKEVPGAHIPKIDPLVGAAEKVGHSIKDEAHELKTAWSHPSETLHNAGEEVKYLFHKYL